MPLYDVVNKSVDSILGWIKSGEVAIPEIQRPFVWEAVKVRDLIDSLYRGFPVGYIITWQNPNIKLKDGSNSKGKKILIDGQQRVTAIQASLAGLQVLDADYTKKNIRIAFNPFEEIFEVYNPAGIENDNRWIKDIHVLFQPGFSKYAFVTDFCAKNNCVGREGEIDATLSKLDGIRNTTIGVIELSGELSIEDVTDIFIRINSKGTVLSQADFAMSKIAADEKFGGNAIRKLIDYFCHFMKRSEDVENILKNDEEFSASEDCKRIMWTREKVEGIYKPDYADVLRVAFTHKFKRGRISDLVNLLSGRNFETRENTEQKAADSFQLLRQGVEAFTSATEFKRFLMIVRSVGIVSSRMVRSQNVLNFAYILYLRLRDMGFSSGKIEMIVRKWILLSILTGRYSSSPESVIDYDIRQFASKNPEEYLSEVEYVELSERFWSSKLVMELNASVSTNPYFIAFLMAQVRRGARGFFSKEIEVRHLIEEHGDIHHLFPKKYLRSNGVNARGDYNQIANYVFTQSEINIAIKDAAPNVYMEKMQRQVEGEGLFFGCITSADDLKKNLAENCIPEGFEQMSVADYPAFLEARRKLMAEYIRDFYYNLG